MIGHLLSAITLTETPTFNHATRGGAVSLWKTVYAFTDAAKQLKARSASMKQGDSRLLQGLAEVIDQGIESTYLWLAEEDATVAESFLRPDDLIDDAISPIAFVRRLQRRSAWMLELCDILETKDDGSGNDAVTLLNKVHTSVIAKKEFGVADSEEMQLEKCFWGVAKPMIDQLEEWLRFGAPFEEHALSSSSELFARNPQKGLFDDGFWLEGFSLQRDADGLPLVPAFIGPHIDGILQAGMSVGLLRAFRQGEAELGMEQGRETGEKVQIDFGAGTDVVQLAQESINSLRPRVRLSQKHALDYFMFPEYEGGCNLPYHLATVHDFFLLRRGADMHAWCEDLFLKVRS